MISFDIALNWRKFSTIDNNNQMKLKIMSKYEKKFVSNVSLKGF